MRVKKLTLSAIFRPDIQLKMFSLAWDDQTAGGELFNLIFHQQPQVGCSAAL